MSTVDQHNEPHLDRLGKILEGGGAAILVGAGTSVACGYPGWSKFLEKLEAPLQHKLSAEYLAELRVKDVRTRLDAMVQVLGNDYPQLFEETFRTREDGPEPLEWIRLLFDLKPRLVLTTNYTTELEAVARRHPSAPLGPVSQPVCWWDARRLAEALRHVHGRAQLIYLHGRYDDAPELRTDDQGRRWSRVVLGEASYKYAYEHPGDVANALKTVCGTHTLLFVGASLADEDVKEAMRTVSAMAGPSALPHFAILPLRAGETADAKAAELRGRFAIQPLFYDVRPRGGGGEDHGALEALLYDLARRASPAVHAPRLEVEIPASGGEYPPHPRIVHPLLRAVDFQPRPEYQRPIDEFIRREQGGVLALVGVGGSGKTALVREALASVVSGPPDARRDGVFVWSFYDEPEAAAFLRSLAGYVGRAELPDDWKAARALDALRRRIRPDTRLLLVLDGLEKLQLERADDEHVHGSLSNAVLRQLLLWLAQAPVAARALVTTRFPLPDLAAETNGERVVVLELDFLTRPQARAFLRQRGVTNGTERDLDALLDHFGAHALTLDHLGGILAAYLDGDPRVFRELGGGPLRKFEAGETGKRLARVVRAYQGYLERDEPEVRATLERVAVFPRPVGARLLARIFLDPKRAEAAGALAGKSELDLRRYLARLVALRFLRDESLAGETVHSIHPALRDAVLEGLGKSQSELAGAARLGMEDDLDGIAGMPGVMPTDPAALDFVEDLVGFCIEEVELERAVGLYWNRLGSYGHLGKQLGDYARGERLARGLVAATASMPRFGLRDRYRLITALALYLTELGRLAEARDWLFLANSGANQLTGEARAVSATSRNLAECEALLGRLPAAEAAARRALVAADEVHDDTECQYSRELVARAQARRGRTGEALGEYAESRWLQDFEDGDSDPLDSIPGFDLQQLLLRCGRAREALVLADATLLVHERQGWKDDTARSQLTRADALRMLGQPDAAEEPLRLAREWALASGHQEILLEARLVGARLLRDQGAHDAARDEAEDGLRAADTCGYGLFAIDFRNVLADLALVGGDTDHALALAREALRRADDAECDDAWGRLDAHDVLARIHRERGDHGPALEHERAAEALRARFEITDDMLPPHMPKGWSPA